MHVPLKGRIGAGWYDVDRTLRLPPAPPWGRSSSPPSVTGSGSPAIADSPHLATPSCSTASAAPVDEHPERPLADGDEIYLLAPLAGG